MATDAIDVALDESRRTLDSQSSDLDGIRTRASFVLAAAGISGGTVLGGLHSQTGFALVAVIAFLAAGALSIGVLIPLNQRWTFTNNAKIIINQADADRSLDVRRWLASVNQTHYEQNQAVLDSLYRLFFAASIALAVAIGATFLSLVVD